MAGNQMIEEEKDEHKDNSYDDEWWLENNPQCKKKTNWNNWN